MGGTESQIKEHISGNVKVGNDRQKLINLWAPLIRMWVIHGLFICQNHPANERYHLHQKGFPGQYVAKFQLLFPTNPDQLSDDVLLCPFG